jgi:hypothetical protein
MKARTPPGTELATGDAYMLQIPGLIRAYPDGRLSGNR